MAREDDKLDILDMHILSRLLNNCRESDRQVGNALGVSGGAVRARIKKMIENGIIEKFAVKIEPPVLGFGVIYLVVSTEKIDSIIKQIKLVGEPFFVVPCVGGITVVSIVVKDELKKSIEITKNLIKDSRILAIFEAESPGFNANLTKTDLEIIEILVKNPREKIETIAESTKLSTKTVTRCLEKLQKSEGIQFTLVYDPTKIKGFIPHAVLAWITGDVRDTLKKLNDKFADYFMQIPIITKNQIVLFMYEDNIYKLDELTQKVRNMENVQDADLFIPKKILFPMEWIKKAITDAKKSPKLHLVYPTN